MKRITEVELIRALEDAYQAGWDASGEGYNSEYPTLRADSLRRWEESRDVEIESLVKPFLTPKKAKLK